MNYLWQNDIFNIQIGYPVAAADEKIDIKEAGCKAKSARY